MTKLAFLEALNKKLSGLPKKEVDERVSFYCEMIDDKIEDGVSEEEAVEQLGSVDDIANQIIGEIPLGKIVKEKVRPKHKLNAFEIVLIILGAPLWIAIISALLGVLIAVYVTVWSMVVVVWAIALAIAISVIGGLIGSAFYGIQGNILLFIALLGAAIFLAGLTIPLYYLCKAITKGIIYVTKKIAFGVKSLFVKKEKVK